MIALFLLNESSAITFNASNITHCKTQNVIQVNDAYNAPFDILSTSITNIESGTKLLQLYGINHIRCRHTTFSHNTAHDIMGAITVGTLDLHQCHVYQNILNGIAMNVLMNNSNSSVTECQYTNNTAYGLLHITNTASSRMIDNA
eukprot:1070188_1